jgi:sugar phosphate permease
LALSEKRSELELKLSTVVSTCLTADDQVSGEEVYRKIAWRLLPLLFLSYLFAFLDRINVGYAQLQMKTMLGFSDSVYGVGAGIFFISYILFEIPSNLWMARAGARFTLSRIMFLWGVISALTMFVKTPGQFYAARFLLGLFEAGFFPGVILYLTYWFPATRRGRVTGLFMLAIPVAGMAGGPLSGWIMSVLNMHRNLAGWQWMYLLEGIPASVLGISCFFYCPDGPSSAVWLNDSERNLIRAALTVPVKARNGRHVEEPLSVPMRASLAIFCNRRILALSFVYFTIACATYTYTFWLPTILSTAGVASIAEIGWLSAIPYCFATAGALAIARSSDLRGERRWHVAVPFAVAALALGGTTFVRDSLPTTILLLSIAAFLQFGAGILFWALLPAYLTTETAPRGIATVSSIGVLGGFAAPTLLGWIKAGTGQLDIGIQLICVLMIAGSITVILCVPRGCDPA